MLTDTHCHVLKEYYDDKKSILDNAKKQGVLRIINAGYNMASSLEVIEDVKKYDNVYGVVGLHPENCLEEFDYKIFDNLPSKIVGIGEIGLDYHYGKENKDEQIVIFERQLEIAERLNLPVVIHSRDATLDTIEILKRHKVKGVIHSFSGSYETACIYIKMGFVLGVNGVVTFKNCNLKDILAKISLGNIILETDSPYLTPVPYRGKRNEPAHIKDVALFLCQLYNVDLATLENITNENIKRIFDI